MGKCAICKAESYNNVLCKKCMIELKQQAKLETAIEFEKQKNLNEEEQSQIFKYAHWEVVHNSFYDNLTEKEFYERVWKIFDEVFCYKLVGCKLYTIKTGEYRHPNDREYDLYLKGL